MAKNKMISKKAPVRMIPSEMMQEAIPDMPIRDWFAGQALAGLTASGYHDPELAAEAAYMIADAMIRKS